MDAAQKLLKNSALLIAATLLATSAFAQTLNVSSTNVGFNSTFQTSTSVNVTSSISSTPITFSVATTYADDGGGAGWLSIQGATTTDTILTFSLARAPQSGGSHQATVTLTPLAPSTAAPVSITVTYTSGTGGGGGGGGSSTITASPSPVFLNAGSNATSAPATVQISTSGTTTLTITNVSTSLTTGTNVNWLSAITSNATVAPNSPGLITVTGYSSGLGTGTYSANITVTPSVGTTLTIPVTFTVNGGGGGSGNWSVNPSSISWNFTTGSGNFSSQNVAITPTSGATYYNVVSINSSNGWLLGSVNGSTGLSFSQLAPGTPLFLTLTGQANALGSGNYTGTVSLSDSNGNQYTLNVNLTVNGGNSNGLNISPNPLTFSAALNSAMQTQTVTMVSNQGGTATVGPLANPPSWLTASGPSVLNPVAGQQTTFTVSANPFNQPSGTYTANIPVGIGSQTGTLTVNLVVGSGSGGGGTGTTAVAPASLNFTYQLGTNPAFVAQQKLVITGPAGSWSSTISSSSTWLKLNPSSGSSLPNPAVSGDTPIVSIDPTNLAGGSYSGTISITTPGGSQNVSVSLNVVNSTILLPTPGSLVFSAQTGQGNPAAQQVFVSDSDSGVNLGTSPISAVSNNSWISVQGVTQNGVTVLVDQTGMNTGTYTGSISISQSGVANTPLTIPVVLVVNGGGGSGGTGTLIFTPSSVAFTGVNGVTSPSSVTLNVSSNSGATSFVGSIAYSPSNVGNWLTVSPLSSVTPSNLSVSANSSGLSNGTYSATVSFNVNGVIQTLPVTLTVTSGGTTGNVTVTPATLNFSTQQGTNPAAQSISVSSASGSAGVPFTVQVTSGSSWLSTSANTSNTTPASFTVSINASGLQAGTYNGNIQVTPNGGTAVNVPVTLSVTSLPTISATPATMTFNYRAGDNAPTPQQITVTGGGAALAFTATATSTGNWLVVSPTTGTTSASSGTPLNVSINPASLQTGTYNGTIQVAGTAGASGSSTISVTLNVTAPLPTISKVTNAASYVSNSISPGEIITLFASDSAHPIGPTTPVGTTLDPTGKFVTTSIGGVQVLVNGFACPMIYASSSQISAVVPYELKLFSNATVTVQVKFLGQTSNGIPVNVATTAPGIFTANSSGTGPGAILNSNNSTNTSSNPATRGDTVVVYMTGEGETSPAGVTGKVTTVASPPQPLTPTAVLPVSVTVGGQPANFSFAGEAPGLVSGVMQLNVILPTNIAAGDQPIVVTIGGNQSQAGVTVSVK